MANNPTDSPADNVADLAGPASRGWAFPLRVDLRGRLCVLSGAQAVESALDVLLGTVAGERVMRPGFGVRLEWTLKELPDRIRELVTEYESRIEVLDVDFEDLDQQWDARQLGWARVCIDYRLKATGEHGRFEGRFEWTR
ncbi:GPW/gp25 family protein [Actinophytocola sp.]|uniref:GPW/gp25 family protein n=1 Tax=Actinophytocola sp. TaxID=1872138 RepID=UPI003D6BA18B